MSDPIADMLTRIRNASERKQAVVVMPASNIKLDIARILKDEGYIDAFEMLDDGPRRALRIKLRYTVDRQPVITSLQRVSRPGRRMYSKQRDIPRVLSGIGIAILTTPKGVMTGKQARREQVGGEVLCYVW
jgi:small subunit ribosomal protein S8